MNEKQGQQRRNQSISCCPKDRTHLLMKYPDTFLSGREQRRWTLVQRQEFDAPQSLTSISVPAPRSRDAGLPAWIGLAIPLQLAADLNNLMVVGAPWSLAFSQGIGTSWPRFAVQARACLFILCLLPSREPTSGNISMAHWESHFKCPP